MLFIYRLVDDKERTQNSSTEEQEQANEQVNQSIKFLF